jgi:hypothetical protein
MKNLGLILIVLFSLNVFAQNAPIEVSNEKSNLPKDIQNNYSTDPDVLKAKRELESSQIKADADETVASEEEESSEDKTEESSDEEVAVTPTPVATPAPVPTPAQTIVKKEKRKFKEVSGDFADDLLMQVNSSDDQIKTIKKKKVKKEKEPYRLFSEGFLARKRYFQLSTGWMNSRWDKIDSNLKKGSRVNALRIVQALSPNVHLGLGLDFVHPKEDSLVPENIRLFQFRVNAEYYKKLHRSIYLISGMGATVADYNIRKVASKSGNTVTYNSYGNGMAFGLIPELGLRFNFLKEISFDIMGDYSYYFTKPESYFSGVGIHLRASFEF